MNIMAWLTASGGDRDGQARALEQDAVAPASPSSSGEREDELTMALGTKLLSGWLSNRSQTLVPHTLNFGALEAGQGALLIDVMAAAAQADGDVDPREAQQLPLALERVGAGELEKQRLPAALAEPQNLGLLLRRVQDEGLASHAYAAALLAINRRAQVNRTFMDYLAGRLGLSPETVSSLERRYRT